MSSWKSVLEGDPIDWLLEEDNPSVRYLTLKEVLDKPENDPEVRSAKNDIMKIGPVPKILAKQKDGGYWEEPERFYRAMYKGTVWQLIILAELVADEADERVRRACEFILARSQDRESGGFSTRAIIKTGRSRPLGVIPCLTGNMVWSLIRLGYLEDLRLKRGIDWITAYQRFDDGIEHRPKGWPYNLVKGCFGTHSCHRGVVKSLKALAEIPADKRSKDVKNTIEAGAEYMLKHHIHKRSHNLNQVSIPRWLRFGFPRMYRTDALEILGIMTKLGYRDERMQEAVDLVLSKQDEKGRWRLESTFNGRFQTNIEQESRPSKWITLKAMTVLKRYYS